MPKYRGRDICDWAGEITRLKRENQLDTALKLALGCMDAMVEAALQNPINVMEYYVIEVAIIQHKMKAYAEQVATLESWLNRGFTAPREDYRLDIQKRLAKAQEMWAKSEGRDSSAFHDQWRQLVEVQKQQKQSGLPTSGVSTGRSFANPTVARVRRSSTSTLVPTRSQLLAGSFVAVDFETANRRGGASACQIALVRIDRGRIIDRYSTLLNPPAEYRKFEFTYIHGIRERDVRKAPVWLDIAGHIADFVRELPVYAHNASFDAGVWRDLDVFYGTSTLPNPFFCSYRTARRVIPGLKNYKLPTVIKACVPNYQLNHHQADSDAEACALIVTDLQKRVYNGG